jgi:hypothetical protein
MQLFAIVDYRKHFVRLPGSMNDVEILCLFSICQKTRGIFFNEFDSHEDIKPYIIEDKGYQLLPWLMMPHKQINVQHSILEALYNKQLSCDKIVENNLGILEKTLCELMIKFNLNMHFFPNAVICCCMLHNIIINGKYININELMQQFEAKNTIEDIHCVLVIRHGDDHGCNHVNELDIETKLQRGEVSTNAM